MITTLGRFIRPSVLLFFFSDYHQGTFTGFTKTGGPTHADSNPNATPYRTTAGIFLNDNNHVGDSTGDGSMGGSRTDGLSSLVGSVQQFDFGRMDWRCSQYWYAIHANVRVIYCDG